MVIRRNQFRTPILRSWIRFDNFSKVVKSFRRFNYFSKVVKSFSELPVGSRRGIKLEWKSTLENLITSRKWPTFKKLKF